MKITYFDPSNNVNFFILYDRLKVLIKRNDVLIITAALSLENKILFNALFYLILINSAATRRYFKVKSSFFSLLS